MRDTLQTRIRYMYRDASNWKFWGTAIVDGELLAEQLQPYLFDHSFFVPHEVGLSHLLDQPMNEDDHYLHSFVDFEATSGEVSLCKAEELVTRFRTANERGWFFVARATTPDASVD